MGKLPPGSPRCARAGKTHARAAFGRRKRLQSGDEFLHRPHELRPHAERLRVGGEHEEAVALVLVLIAPAHARTGERAGEGLDDQAEQETLVAVRRAPERQQRRAPGRVEEAAGLRGRLARAVDQPALGHGLALVHGHPDLAEGHDGGRDVDHQRRLAGCARDAAGQGIGAEEGRGAAEGRDAGAAARVAHQEERHEALPRAARPRRHPGGRHRCHCARRHSRCPGPAPWHWPAPRRRRRRPGRDNGGHRSSPQPRSRAPRPAPPPARSSRPACFRRRWGCALPRGNGSPRGLASSRVSVSTGALRPGEAEGPEDVLDKQDDRRLRGVDPRLGRRRRHRFSAPPP